MEEIKSDFAKASSDRVDAPVRPVDAKKQEAEKRKKNMEFLRAKDREKVKGVFRFYESPGGELSFPFKKWKGDPLEIYKLQDGQTYELPLGVAKHLNNNGWYPVHMHRIDEFGKPHQLIGQKVKRFGFTSLEFTEIEGMENHGSVISVVPDIVVTGKMRI